MCSMLLYGTGVCSHSFTQCFVVVCFCPFLFKKNTLLKSVIDKLDKRVEDICFVNRGIVEAVCIINLTSAQQGDWSCLLAAAASRGTRGLCQREITD